MEPRVNNNALKGNKARLLSKMKIDSLKQKPIRCSVSLSLSLSQENNGKLFDNPKERDSTRAFNSLFGREKDANDHQNSKLATARYSKQLLERK